MPSARARSILVPCLALASFSAQSPSESQPQFRTGVEVVRLDVLVLDKDRRPIRGLTAPDFTVLELAVGEYLLTLDATLGKTVVRRDARFAVR